jgi:hypothetical protein
LLGFIREISLLSQHTINNNNRYSLGFIANRIV